MSPGRAAASGSSASATWGGFAAECDAVWPLLQAPDVASCPDFLVAGGDVASAEAKRRIVERLLILRRPDGSLSEAFHCAV
jgi:hypothetical protein